MGNITREELGLRIRDLRVKHSKSQEELGRFLEKSHAAISDIERGKTELSVSDLSKIVEYFNVPVSEILGEPQEQTGVSFSHHRADRGLSSEEKEKIMKARQEFIKEARGE